MSEILKLLNEEVELIIKEGFNSYPYATFKVSKIKERWVLGINGRYSWEFDSRADALRYLSGVLLKLSLVPESQESATEGGHGQ